MGALAQLSAAKGRPLPRPPDAFGRLFELQPPPLRSPVPLTAAINGRSSKHHLNSHSNHHTQRENGGGVKGLNGASEAPARLLATCVRLACFAHALRMMAATTAGLPFLCSAGGAALAIAALVPTLPALAIPAMLVRVFNRFGKMPLMHDSQYWVLQMDCALILAYLAVVCRRRTIVAAGESPSSPPPSPPPAPLRCYSATRGESMRHKAALGIGEAARGLGTKLCTALNAAEQGEVIARARPIIQWQLAWFYLAAGVWKINSGFLHPRYSCASVFTLMLLDYLPSSADAAVAEWAPLIASLSPVAVLVLEIGVGVALIVRPRTLGVLGVLLLHIAIAFVPP